jgi:DNA-binding beta-propeller fold protein YncE
MKASTTDAGIRVKIGKVLTSSAVLATLMALMAPSAALANGVGDLYVASPSGVLEVHVVTSTVISVIPVAPSPQSVVFSPDGRTLYASTAGPKVTPVDIATLEVQASLTMPGPVSSLAFPAGQVLVAAMPQRRSLAFVTVHGGAVTESGQLPGPGNILAGDRREARVAVAQAGADWLEVVDPGTETMRKATVPGEIVDLAIDRDKGAVVVATRNPDAALLVDLTSLATIWTVALSGTPDAVAAMSSAIVVGAGKNLWKVDGKSAVAFATTREQILAMTPSDEGSVIHVAEDSGIEVFDSAGKLQRTLELKGERAPVWMAAVNRGSSLFVGMGGASASPSSKATMPPASVIGTPDPPTTSTIVDTATQIAGSAPFQSAAVVGLAILFLCWLFIRWYDRRALRPR